MNDITLLRLILYRANYLLFGAAIILIGLVPFDLTAGRTPGPNILFCFTFVLVIRRPEFVPVWAIFAVFFLQEIFTSSAFGLWTLLVVLATELVRANVQAFREYSFPMQCLWFGSVFGGMLAAQKLVLTLVFADAPTFNAQAIVFMLTFVCYPVIVALIHFVFDIDSPAVGEVNERGQRI